MYLGEVTFTLDRLAEITVVVARLLADLELATSGAQPQVTTRSATGLNVKAQRRR